MKKILIVDDTPDILHNLQELLTMEGHEVLTAANGKEAWDILQIETPDLIVTDLVMPEMTGVELIKKIKANKKFLSIPILIFSARPKGDNWRIEDLRADCFLLKPSHTDVLIKNIEELLDRSRD